ncbi:nitroreductase family protein [Cetobacterium sp.]|uniref:nitroreductase family protein n=1 Tax=Cetobacterium sp. TaxID=2071632 RepID=UPI003F3F0C4F
MDIITGIKERRSIRNFKEAIVDRTLINEIMDATRFAPSWGNFQIVRYTFIENKKLITKLAQNGVNDFIYNIETLKAASNVLVLSYVKGKSGKIEDMNYDSGTNEWEIFDAGIACQTFCLAAHAKGIGTVVMGVINNEEISKIVNLPENETVAALIVYGYPNGGCTISSSRKSISEIIRFK